MPIPDVYRAVVIDQQVQLAKLVKSAGLDPVRKLYQGMLDEVERKLKRTATGTFTHAQLRGVLAQIKLGLAGVIRQISGHVGEAAYKVGLASARRMLTDVAKLEKHFTGLVVPLPLLETAHLSGIVRGEVSSLMRVHETSMARYGAHLVGRMEMELGAAVAAGDGHAEAIDRIVKVGDLEWWRAERIVRTELSFVSHASQRAASEEQSRELGGDLWMRWNEHVSDDGAPLDDRVGVDSEAMHGQVAPPGGDFTQPPRAPDGESVGESLVGDKWKHPPNRPNDRAVLAPWRHHWGISGWVWRGRRVPVTARMAAELSAAWVGKAAVHEVRSAPVEAVAVAPPVVEKATPDEPKKNPKRVEAARRAGAASAERRREIHSAVKSNLPQELHVVWDREGHKFLRQEAARIRGIDDPISAASKISEAFAETYGSGGETAFGNEGDRYFKRAELEAQHAETWADEQERKYYEEAHRAALEAGDIDERGELTAQGHERLSDEHEGGVTTAPSASNADDDPPF